MTTATDRVLSGMRPTGRLHIGHYFGALQNWVRLQNDPSYDCLYFVADWHALTSDYAESVPPSAENTMQSPSISAPLGLTPPNPSSSSSPKSRNTLNSIFSSA